MMDFAQEKHTIAWFKLAEFVARGDKERALGLHRLLMHSVNDQAFSFQLEGDLLRAFNDTAGARERYMKAAELYRSEHRLIQAAAVYEHLITLDPSEYESRLVVMQLYGEIGSSHQCMQHAPALIRALVDQGQAVAVHEVCRVYIPLLDPLSGAQLCGQAVLALAPLEGCSQELIALAKHACQGLARFGSDGELGRFMASLEVLQPALYERMVAFLSEM